MARKKNVLACLRDPAVVGPLINLLRVLLEQVMKYSLRE
jgi:hypothetical protein